MCYLYYKVRYLYDFICVVIRGILGLHCGFPPTYFLLWQPRGILIVIFIVVSSCTFPLTFLFPFLLKHSKHSISAEHKVVIHQWVSLNGIIYVHRAFLVLFPIYSVPEEKRGDFVLSVSCSLHRAFQLGTQSFPLTRRNLERV